MYRKIVSFGAAMALVVSSLVAASAQGAPGPAGGACCAPAQACCQASAPQCCAGRDAACCARDAACCAGRRAERPPAAGRERRSCEVTGKPRPHCCASKASPMPPCCQRACSTAGQLVRA